ncbi:MAG: nucleoside phosphorylase [Deltaproteobacteria bacterium]|nr:nucleoside phosphorylase [Deltaproteobacteria bacterium]
MADRPPILEHPGFGPGVIEPARLYRKRRRIPSRVVLCFFLDILKRKARSGQIAPLTRLAGEGEAIEVWSAGRGRKALGVCFPGVGAPFAASTLEELIALGGRAFIACGAAGVLDSQIEAGAIILPTAALRDEGTSYHYQRRGRYSRPHPEALRAIRAACRHRGLRYRSGRIWTTDAVFRETVAQVRRRREEGCLAVEMEAASLFAVAAFRKVIFGQLLYAGDDVSAADWKHRRWMQLDRVRAGLFELALDACRRLPGADPR